MTVTAIYVESDQSLSLDRGTSRMPIAPEPTSPSFIDGDAGLWRADTSRAWVEVRIKRDALLSSCDWTQLADAPLTLAQKAAWTTYRQQLRDITKQPDPLALTWPQEPAA